MEIRGEMGFHISVWGRSHAIRALGMALPIDAVILVTSLLGWHQ